MHTVTRKHAEETKRLKRNPRKERKFDLELFQPKFRPTNHSSSRLTPTSTCRSSVIGSTYTYYVNNYVLALKNIAKNIYVEKTYYIRKVGGGGGQAELRKKKSECWSLFHVPPPPCLCSYSG